MGWVGEVVENKILAVVMKTKPFSVESVLQLMSPWDRFVQATEDE